MAVSFRVTQYAHQTASAYTSAPPKAVHAVIPKAIFPPGLRDQVQRWLRPGTAAAPVTLSPADRLDILDLLTRADAAASARDAAAYLALFTNDAVLDGDQGNYHGREALRRGLAAGVGRRASGNPSPDAEPGHRRGPGLAGCGRGPVGPADHRPGDAPGAGRAAAHITQYLRRGADGWRITRRSVEQ